MKNFLIKTTKSAKRLKQLYDSNRIAAYSAQAAFFVLLSLVPLVLLALVFAGAVFPFDAVQTGQLLYGIFTHKVSEYVMGIYNEIAHRSSIPLASVTTVFLVWAATKGIRSIADGIQNIYDADAQYNIVWLTVRSVLYTFVMFGVVALSLIGVVFSSPVEMLLTQLLGEKASLIMAVLNMRNIILFFAFTLLFALAYKTLAKSGINLKKQLPGAAFAAAGWILYSVGYSVYIKYFSRYSVLYGSFGAIMLFMLWLYMCMNILLCGALANKLFFDRKCD